MVRKAIIVALTVAAVGMAVIEVTSFRPRASEFDSDWLFVSDVSLCTSCDGVLALFFHRCPQCGSYGKHVASCSHSDVFPSALPSPPLVVRRFAQFGWHVWQSPGSRTYVLSFPTWAPFVLFAAYPTIAFIRGPLRRHRRRRKGLCVACGYNLTGNVSGVCSECGTKIEQPSSVT